MTPSRPLLTVLIPAHDERPWIERVVERVRRLELDLEVVAIDDGSADGTGEIMERLRGEGALDRVIRHRRRRGKGAAVRAGIAASTGEIVVIQDADLEYDPAEIPSLMAPVLAGDADAVFGSRFLGQPRRVLYFWHRVGNLVVTTASNALTNLNLTDMETGYKLVRGDLLRALPLRSDRFGIEPELTARLAQAGARIYEVPISYRGRTYAEGKKIRWTDGIAAIGHVLRANLLSPRLRRLSRDAGEAFRDGRAGGGPG